MNIKINKPYKVTNERLKRYQAHYQIPADRALLIPVKAFGDQVSCDIRWEDENGQMHIEQNKVFAADSLVSVNPLMDIKLFELWQHYYEGGNAQSA